MVNVLEEAHSRFKEETMSGAGVWFAPSTAFTIFIPGRDQSDFSLPALSVQWWQLNG